MWRFPLLPIENAPAFDSQHYSQQILRAQPPPIPDTILNVYDLKTKPELIRYYHADAGFTTKPTWTDAIKNGHYKSWPGLDRTMAAKYFPGSVETGRGHGCTNKSGLRPNKQSALEEEAEPEPPTSEGGRALILKTYDLHYEFDNRLNTDQTGRFPYTSFKGNQYVMVAYDTHGSIAILAQAMRNRTAGSILEAYKTIIEQLPKGEARTTVHIPDNEYSKELKKANYRQPNDLLTCATR